MFNKIGRIFDQIGNPADLVDHEVTMTILAAGLLRYSARIDPYHITRNLLIIFNYIIVGRAIVF